MIIIQLDQTYLLPFSALLGLFFGSVYGTIKIIRCLFYHNNAILFFEDAVFMIFASVSFVLLHYNCTYGVIRFYSFIGFSAGFMLYHLTVGKLSERIALKFKKLIMPYFLMIKGLFLKFYSFTAHCVRTEKMIRRAGRGFSL